MLTWLAAEGAPGLIATVLGVACRTLRYREHQVKAGGSLVPAWVAATFQIARRTVAHWLQRLRALHWLAPIATPPAHRAVYGPWVAINLQWAPPAKTPADKNLATPPCLRRRNLATPRKNLATPPAPSPPEALEIACVSAFPGPPHGNPVPDTQPIKHHENPGGDCAPAQEHARRGADPAAHYATLAPDLQATLYHDAAARLQQQYPTDFVIRPVVLAEVYRRLETPRPPVTPGGHVCPMPEPSALLPDAGGTPPHSLEETRRLSEPSQPTPAAPPPLLQSLPRAPQAASQGSHATSPLPTEPGAPGERPHPPPPPPQAPGLQAITPPDLADVARLRALWQQAQGRGWVGGSDADWLTVVTAAQHALRVGQNPGGLFVAVLRQQAWHLLTQADEDAARQVLRAAHGPLTASERHVLHQLFGKGKEALTRAAVPPLSLDAQCAREALRLCQTARWQSEPFLAVHAADPAWSRVRWDAALAELEQWQLRQQVANAQHQQALARAWGDETQDASASASAAEQET